MSAPLRPLDPAAAAAEAEGGSQTVRALLRLRQLILDGELAPGSRISEPALAERLGVSRTPIRAALAKLAEEGFLQPIASGSGWTVEAFTEDDVADAIEVRGTLEGLAARLAAERGVPPRLLAELQREVDAIDTVLAAPVTEESFQDYVTHNGRLHALLAEAAGSPVLRRQIERAHAMPFASPNGFVNVQAAMPASHDVLRLAQEQHRAIVEAIGRREGSRAEALAREHARIAHRNLSAVLRSEDALQRLPGGRLIQRHRGR